MANKKAISAGTGRRKTATARVNLVEGKGLWTVNGVALEEYLPSEALRDYLKQPVAISGYDMDKVDVVAFAKGGGIAGQAGAIRHSNTASRAMRSLWWAKANGPPGTRASRWNGSSSAP